MWRNKTLSSADVSTNLFLVSAPCEIADAHCGPAELAHRLGQPSIRPRCAAALRYLKYVQERLRAHALQTVEVHLAAHALQPQTPRIGVICSGFGLGGSELCKE